MKRWRVVVKRQAEKDITEIWNIILENNLKAADTFLDAIGEASALLAATPEIGSPRYFSHPELQGLRFLPLSRFENYLLFYRALKDEEVVEIVRILHGARDCAEPDGSREGRKGISGFARSLLRQAELTSPLPVRPSPQLFFDPGRPMWHRERADKRLDPRDRG